MTCILKKQRRFPKNRIADEIKDKIERLEIIVKGLTIDSRGEGQLAFQKRDAAAWGDKCIQTLSESLKISLMMLPPRKKQQADIIQRRILQTLQEIGKTMLDCGIYYGFLEQKIYPLTQTLARQLDELTTL